MNVIGIDEAGRGCWAGPIFASAVMLAGPIIGLTDSKLISIKKREELYSLIISNAKSYGVGSASALEIDELGLTIATKLAMKRALNKITTGWDTVIIDGNYNYLCECTKIPCSEGFKPIVKADRNYPAVSAASILAKVSRDRLMRKIHNDYPQYHFDKHVGYGTRQHIRALDQFGPCPIHRKSFKPIAEYI